MGSSPPQGKRHQRRLSHCFWAPGWTLESGAARGHPPCAPCSPSRSSHSSVASARASPSSGPSAFSNSARTRLTARNSGRGGFKTNPQRNNPYISRRLGKGNDEIRLTKLRKPKQNTYELQVPGFGTHHHRERLQWELVHRALRPLDDSAPGFISSRASLLSMRGSTRRRCKWAMTPPAVNPASVRCCSALM